MALQRAKLGDIQYIASTAGSVYTNAASTKTYVRGFTFHNTNTSTEVVKVYVVPDSGGALGTAGVSNKIMEFNLTAGDTVTFEFPYSCVLTDTNDSVQAATTTASKVTIIVHGDKDA